MKRLKSGSAWLLAVLFIVSVTVGLMVFSRGDDSRAPQAAALTTTPTLPPYPIGTPTPWPTLVVPATPTDTPVGFKTPTRTPPPPTPTHTPTRTPTATPMGTPTPIDTRTWKIYENAQYGFRIKYPTQYTYSLYGSPGAEILHDMIFYDGAKYQPGVSRDFPLVGLHVVTNPQRLSINDWAKAHLFSSPNSNQYSLNFESYQIVRTLPIAGIQASRLTTISGEGIKSYVILIPLLNESKIIYIYYHLDPPTIEPFFEVMALTLERTR